MGTGPFGVAPHSGPFGLVPAALIFDTRLSAEAKVVYAALASHADQGGECWPRLRGLAAALGVQPPTISKRIAELEALGYIETVRDRQNRYYLPDLARKNMSRKFPPRKLDEAEKFPVGKVSSQETHRTDQKREREHTGVTLDISGEDLSLSAAASHAHTRADTHTREGTPDAAAAEGEKALTETAEAVRRLLRMDRSKLPGLRLVVAQYPDARAWLQNQANLCFESLKVRPLELKHFSNWLDECERRRSAAREETSHDESTTAAETPAPATKARRDADELTDDEREAIKAKLNAHVAQLFGANTAG